MLSRDPSLQGSEKGILRQAGFSSEKGFINHHRHLLAPGSDLLEIADVATNGGIGQAGGGSSEHEAGQHVGLEIRQLLGSGWSPVLPKIRP